MEKTALVKWLNDFFHADIKKVEEMSTGAMHCQILDAIFPQKVPLHKVNFAPKREDEFINNFKVLQAVFSQQGIQKPVDVARLIKGKMQDNLEFLQWMKGFFDSKYGGQPYPAVERREQSMKQFNSTHNTVAKASGLKKPGAAIPGATPVAAPAPAAAPAAHPVAAHPAPTHLAATHATNTPTKPHSAAVGIGAAAIVTPPKSAPKSSPAPVTRHEEMHEAAVSTPTKLGADLNVEELIQTIRALESQRDFYFGKLRRIELFCEQDQTLDAQSKNHVLKVLYQSPEEAAAEGPVDTNEVIVAPAPVILSEAVVSRSASPAPRSASPAPRSTSRSASRSTSPAPRSVSPAPPVLAPSPVTAAPAPITASPVTPAPTHVSSNSADYLDIELSSDLLGQSDGDLLTTF